ncbi:MAG: integrase [Pseudanabaena sp.]|nr:MAG: integrase [Pseudanabaena sp.]
MIEPNQINPLALKVVAPSQAVDETDQRKKELICERCSGNDFVKRRKSTQGYQIYLCIGCGRHLTDSPPKYTPTSPEMEYFKNVWDCRNFGVESRVGKYQYKLNFSSIQPEWLLKSTKQFIRYSLSNVGLSSCSARLEAIKHFSLFLVEQYPSIKPESITRDIAIHFLSYIAAKNLSASWRCHTIGALRIYFEACIINDWIPFRRHLIRHEDFPKRSKSIPRFIPEEVMTQLNQYLPELAEPVQRMILVLQDCGMRISELLLMKYDCLSQDKSGDWFLQYHQFKMKKDITIPISRELVGVIQEQQRYIREALLDSFKYLFCANESGSRVSCGAFSASPRPMSATAFSKMLNDLGEKHSICNAAGDRWHFQTHQFRHTVGTRMINSGVPQHIIQRYLGHETPDMTAVYATIHDKTMKQEVSKFHDKIVNISGQIVESDSPNVDTADLQWFKHNIQAQALPNGSCALPIIAGECPHANACLTCTHFRTSGQYLDEHKKQLDQTKQLAESAESKGWNRQAEMNRKVQASLENIIKTLEG